MCIIMVKPKGVKLPDKKTFKTCFERNPDGCGYMYVDNGKVIIKKGFMGYNNMYKQIKRLGDRNIVVHFRIGTSGKNDQKTCHPYPISREVSDLQAGYLETNIGVVHNGIISEYNGKDKILNDTQLYIQDRMCMLQDLNSEFYANDDVLNFLYKDTYTKFVFLDANDELYYSGSFINETDGMIYSNTTYKSYCVSDYKYTPYSYDYDEDVYVKNSNLTTYKASIDDVLDDEDYVYTLKEYEYIKLDVGDLVQLKYDKYIDVDLPNQYALDKSQNLLVLDDDYLPAKVLHKNVTVFNKDYKEIYV